VDQKVYSSPLQGAARPNMMWIPGGIFRMGSDDHYPEEAPAHRYAKPVDTSTSHFRFRCIGRNRE